MNFISTLTRRFQARQPERDSASSSAPRQYDANDQDSLWKEQLALQHSIEPWTPVDPATPKPEGAVRIVCISDTHNRRLPVLPPPGDILLHAGDFSGTGTLKEVEAFSAYLGELAPHYGSIVVIAGNHDLPFDVQNYAQIGPQFHRRGLEDPDKVRAALQNCIYVEHEAVEVQGVRFFGSPFQPEFCNWAFNVDRGEALAAKWRDIPADIDVLVTHGPPLGIGDLVVSGQHVGCADLLREVTERVRPRFHVFGHIHESPGAWTNGETVFINASSCTIAYRALNPPIVFDFVPITEKSI